MRTDHFPKEAEMRRILAAGYGLRLSLLTAVVTIIAAVTPLLALAANGDPTGS